MRIFILKLISYFFGSIFLAKFLFSNFEQSCIIHFSIHRGAWRDRLSDQRHSSIFRFLEKKEEKVVNFYYSLSRVNDCYLIFRPNCFNVFSMMAVGGFFSLFLKISDETLLNWMIGRVGPSAFVSVDDLRRVSVFAKPLKELEIPFIGYQHAGFSRTSDLEFVKFDRYLVWSKYWKEEYLKSLSNMKAEEVMVIGHPTHNSSSFMRPAKEKIENVMIIGENCSPFHYEKLVIPLTVDNLNVFFRPKPFKRYSSFELKFLEANGIQTVGGGEFVESLVEYRIDLIIGTRSTCLIESCLYGVGSCVVDVDDSYSDHLIHYTPLKVLYRSEDLKSVLDISSENYRRYIRLCREFFWGLNEDDYVLDRDELLDRSLKNEM